MERSRPHRVVISTSFPCAADCGPGAWNGPRPFSIISTCQSQSDNQHDQTLRWMRSKKPSLASWHPCVAPLGYTLWSRFLRYDPDRPMAKRDRSAFGGMLDAALYVAPSRRVRGDRCRGPGTGDGVSLTTSTVSAVAFETRSSDMLTTALKPQPDRGTGCGIRWAWRSPSGLDRSLHLFHAPAHRVDMSVNVAWRAAILNKPRASARRSPCPPNSRPCPKVRCGFTRW